MSLHAIWAFFRIPGPRGRTFEELNVLFEAKVAAKMFRHTTVYFFTIEKPKAMEEDNNSTVEEA